MLWVPFKYTVSAESEQLIRLETGEDKTITTILAERPELGSLACTFRPPESPKGPILVIIGQVASSHPKDQA